jgi:hypothetical protein
LLLLLMSEHLRSWGAVVFCIAWDESCTVLVLHPGSLE